MLSCYQDTIPFMLSIHYQLMDLIQFLTLHQVILLLLVLSFLIAILSNLLAILGVN